MWDSEFIGHQRQRAWFSTAVRRGRLASTFLFVGPPGCGKRMLALRLSKLLLCLARTDDGLDCCGRCESCVQFEAGTNPDFFAVSKPPDRAALPMELLVGSRENRLRDGLCHQLHIRPFHGKRRIAVIDDADTIQAEAANSMLKTLEEPPAGAVIFLVGSNEQRQLPTIRSRSQVIRFQGLSVDETIELLSRRAETIDPQTIRDVAAIAGGSLTKAEMLLDDDMRELRSELYRELDSRPIPFIKIAKSLTSNLQSLGDESQAKRDRMRLVFDFAIDYFRAGLYSEQRSAAKHSSNPSPAARPVIDRRMVAAMQLCLSAQNDIDRNATPAGLLEAWAAELAAILGA